MVVKAGHVNQGELPCERTALPGAAAVRAFVVATKLRNGSGAKGGRKVDSQ